MVKAPNNPNKDRKSGLVFARGLETIYKKKKFNLYGALGSNLIRTELILLSFP